MHIPDGYLSPKTCAVFYAVAIPLWYVGAKRVQRDLKMKQLPLLALGAAFSFVVMLFNIPIPGGSTGHMTGSVILSIALGPWASFIALSLTLALQAFLFADGGITTFGANTFNMAFLMSFIGYYVYRIISSGNATPVRRAVAAGVAGYLALTASAFAAGVELGIQPIIAAGADGHALYAPYPLAVTIPAMLVPHLLFFSVIEGVGGALVVSYVSKVGDNILKPDAGRHTWRPLLVFVIVLIILTPLGLMASGGGLIEWSRAEIISIFGYMPSGMESVSSVWKGVVPNYGGVEGVSGKLKYILSAAVGSALVMTIIYLWGRTWRK